MRLDYKLVANILKIIGPSSVPEIIKAIQNTVPTWSQPEKAEATVRSALRSNSLEALNCRRIWFRRTEPGGEVWELLPDVPIPQFDLTKPSRGQITFWKALHALRNLKRPSSVDDILDRIQDIYLVNLGINTRKTLSAALRENCENYWRPGSKHDRNLFAVNSREGRAVLWSVTAEGATVQFLDEDGETVDVDGSYDPDETEDAENAADEGRRIVAEHIKFERRSAKAKEFKDQLKSLKCEACRFDFHKKYGDLGHGFVEAHHAVPLSEGRRQTKIEDFRAVCSNCHQMLHRNRLRTVEELVQLIREQKDSRTDR